MRAMSGRDPERAAAGRGLQRGARIGMALAVVLALLAGGVSYAVTGGATTTITACASKKTGALRLLGPRGRCKRSERDISWNQVGPAGQRGPIGLQGPPGTVDTSRVYTKSESDSKYLALHGTADDSNQL